MHTQPTGVESGFFQDSCFFSLLAPLRIDAEAISKSNISLTKKNPYGEFKQFFLLTLWRWEESENLFDIYPPLTDLQDRSILEIGKSKT